MEDKYTLYIKFHVSKTRGTSLSVLDFVSYLFVLFLFFVSFLFLFTIFPFLLLIYFAHLLISFHSDHLLRFRRNRHILHRYYDVTSRWHYIFHYTSSKIYEKSWYFPHTHLKFVKLIVVFLKLRNKFVKRYPVCVNHLFILLSYP